MAAARWSGASRSSRSETEDGSTASGWQVSLRWRLFAFGLSSAASGQKGLVRPLALAQSGRLQKSIMVSSGSFQAAGEARPWNGARWPHNKGCAWGVMVRPRWLGCDIDDLEGERVRTVRLARMGSITSLLLAVVACSNAATPSPTASPRPIAPATPSPTVVASSSGLTTPSPIPTMSPTASPRPMAPATVTPGPSMTTARDGQASVRLKDGRVLMMGGAVPFVGKCPMACIPPVTASVEIYDPKTRKFSVNGSLAAPRTGGEALLLNDGRVLVVGGDGYGNWITEIEIYDPATKTSVVVTLPADIQKLPVYPAVVLLADGRVLIAGGSYDDLDSTSDVTLIFDPASGGFTKGA